MADVERPTDEVGSEGGTVGNLEQRDEETAARGSENTSTIDSVDRKVRTVVRDETGPTGRRSPIGSSSGPLESGD